MTPPLDTLFLESYSDLSPLNPLSEGGDVLGTNRNHSNYDSFRCTDVVLLFSRSPDSTRTLYYLTGVWYTLAPLVRLRAHKVRSTLPLKDHFKPFYKTTKTVWIGVRNQKVPDRLVDRTQSLFYEHVETHPRVLQIRTSVSKN